MAPASSEGEGDSLVKEDDIELKLGGRFLWKRWFKTPIIYYLSDVYSNLVECGFLSCYWEQAFDVIFLLHGFRSNSFELSVPSLICPWSTAYRIKLICPSTYYLLKTSLVLPSLSVE